MRIAAARPIGNSGLPGQIKVRISHFSIEIGLNQREAVG